MGRAKKQKIVYKQDTAAKANELETFLFGGQSNPAELFERPAADSDDDAELAELVHKVGQGAEDRLLFFEDKSKDKDVAFELSGDDEEDSEDEGRGGSSDSEEGDEGAAGASQGSEEEEEDDEGAGASGRAAPQPKAGPSGRGGCVWHDPDDDNLTVAVAAHSRLRKLRTHEKQTEMNGSEYERALRAQHAKLNPRTEWARPGAQTKAAKRAAAALQRKQGEEARGYGSDDDEGGRGNEDDEEGRDAQALLQTAGGLLSGRSRGLLPPGSLETTRLKDANQHEPSGAVVASVRFHPNGQVALTAGLDKKLRLFQVDGLRNPRLQTAHFDDMPLHAAEFASGGSQVVLSGRRPHFYVYDLASSAIERVAGLVGAPQKSLETFATSPPEASGGGAGLLAFAGDQGVIPLVSLASRQWVGNLKMSGSVRSLAFSPTGNDLLSSGSDGMVYIWDLRMRRCRAQMRDHGNAGAGAAPSLAVSPDYRYLATGSAAGVVNVYSREAVEGAVSGAGRCGAVSVAPLKEIGNLTTSIDTLLFSPDSQMLALASRMTKDAFRLLHVPSLTVFSNWPTSRSPLNFVHSAAFSPHGGFLAIGNAKGRALLYRMHHYAEA